MSDRSEIYLSAVSLLEFLSESESSIDNSGVKNNPSNGINELVK